jgi:uncharacterized protein YbjT (DUF2867 family)
MRILIFGATGMVGQGVLRESLEAADVELVQTIGRAAVGTHHSKLVDLLHADLFDYHSIEGQLSGFDACFFCLGVSAPGMTEQDYTHLTYDLTLAAGATLVRLNPAMTFVYVSGAGTDASEQGSRMWARVKGRTENALRRLPFKAVYLFRPGLIQPLHGIRSKTRSYRIFYTLTAPILPLVRALAPNLIVTTAQMGQAMLNVTRRGWPNAVLEARDIAHASR